MDWKPIETAPKDGTRFIGWLRAENRKRNTWYGKVSHVPIYGWCWGRNVEDVDVWKPTHWRPMISNKKVRGPEAALSPEAPSRLPGCAAGSHEERK